MATKPSTKTAAKKVKEENSVEVAPKAPRTKKVASASKSTTAKEAPAKVAGNFVDMNRTFFVRKEDNEHPKWRVIDAKGKVLGRMATQIADILRGKDKAYFTPHTDTGDYVVVINASQIALTGNKLNTKEYAHYTGWIGGYKVATAKELLAKHPERLVMLAVKGMLPKNILSRYLMRKLRVYPGTDHPHTAQKPFEHAI